MFGWVRIIISAIILAIAIILIAKSKKIVRKRKWYVLSCILSLAFCTLLGLVYFENLFVTFDSPESAYIYYQNVSDIVATVDGTDSTLVVGRTWDNSYNMLALPKENGGWKLDNTLHTKLIVNYFSADYSIIIYQYRNTNDYYVWITPLNGGSKEITDIYGSDFVAIEPIGDDTIVRYLASVQQMDSQYWINIDGEQIFVVNEANMSKVSK